MARNIRAASHPIEVRIANLERVLRAALARREPFTRGNLMAETGFSAPTMGALLNDLFRLELLQYTGSRLSTGGRRAELIEVNPRSGFLIGIDVAPDRTRLALADLRQELLAHKVLDTVTPSNPRQFLADLAHELHNMMSEGRLSRDRLLAVGVGISGVVNEEAGVAVGGIPGWKDVHVRETLENAFSSPVSVASSVNLAMLAEHTRGAARGHDVCVCISVGRQLGASIFVRGQLHRGASFMAGQLGAMCMGLPYVDASLGEHGSLENLAEAAVQAAKPPWTAERDPALWIPAVVEAAERGDTQARAAVLEVARFVGIAAANLAALIDPSIIVVGGPLLTRAPSLVAAVAAIVQSISSAPVAVVPWALGDEAPLWGGLLSAWNSALERLSGELRQQHQPPD